ncbi:zinc-dependent metalloprotease [Galbibacter sp. EGI 63066]|uniref:zinc-dependent metalloprotease n=1 Tax=Galbibacter sp. EGI 63066 TaxID=2993559 RepID=UPI002248E522|nr:zinc-dependent metalloprotease [Galbibacter sp. EGI 63066]MCX2679094.1 zinc-dependent metalloprotease [Galbibacter sp. EGI 63066]
MKHPFIIKNCLLLLLVLVSFSLKSQDKSKTEFKAEDHKKFDGFYDFYYSEKDDKVYLEVKELEKEFLYVYSLSSGVGSNDIGLDRGQLGNEQLVYFTKAGNKLLLIQPNLKYRALTDNDLEKKSVEQAFAKSVLYGFKITSEKEDTYIIDITDFLMEDAHGVAKTLKSRKQGEYKLDKSKSAMNMERTKAFPKNIEFDVLMTFKGSPKGGEIRSVAPNSELVTVTEHHSFIELPNDDFEMRKFDPRSGTYPFSYYDYAAPVQESMQKRFVVRHRLEKKDPNATVSEAVEPIVYYLDNGTPEPVRSALLEGGRWWNQAFEAIGYKNAFQLKILPDDADPMDIRYNVIQWVHRSTRGWSYGSSIRDPRTGEILKGHVSLGSLRIRQDFLIAQALMNKPFAQRDDNYQPMLEMALARIRQLSAHEIGHTLGFAHNFAASASTGSSVMDYPHPMVRLNGETIDISNAYEVGIGDWDKVSVAYAYSDFPEGTDEKTALAAIIKEAQERGYRFISDRDARPQGGAHATAHLWDNGKDAGAELDRVMEIRRKAIDQFSIDNMRSDEPFSVLEDVFVPVYFFHRYQTEAAVKHIAGLDYNYAIKNDGQTVVEFIDKQKQQESLKSLLKTIEAENIAIPKEKLSLFPPRTYGYGKTRESLKGKTGVAFDAIAAAETASDMTLKLLMYPQRVSRLIQQKAIDKKQLGLAEVISATLKATLYNKNRDTYYAEVQQAINYRVIWHLMALSINKKVHPQVNAVVNNYLTEIQKEFEGSKDVNEKEIARRIAHFYENLEDFKLPDSPKIPDGSPIGMDCF